MMIKHQPNWAAELHAQNANKTVQYNLEETRSDWAPTKGSDSWKGYVSIHVHINFGLRFESNNANMTGGSALCTRCNANVQLTICKE